MNKTLNTVILFFLGQSVIAQKGIDNLIQAEKNFAAYSVAHSTKEAFQQFIDSNSIMFDNGKPVKAIEFWEKREKNAGVLNWWPQYAEISASGDFGYTTGPWTFQPTKNDSIAARGQYTTVWHINTNGEWKFLVDLGITNTKLSDITRDSIRFPLENVIRINEKKKSKNSKAIPKIFQMVAAENNFLEIFEKKGALKAYNRFQSKGIIMNQNNFLPILPSHVQYKMILLEPRFDKYAMEGWGVSLVPDMGYTYGSTMANGKSENYLRISGEEKNPAGK